MLSNIIIFGPPGSGKGTNSTRLASNYGFHLVQMSSVLSSCSYDLSSYFKQGNLVPDNVVINVLKEYLFGAKSGILFDGFPRNTDQASFLVDYIDIHKVFLLTVSDETVIKRMLVRRVCSSCSHTCSSGSIFCSNCGSEDLIAREDDSEDIVKKRLRDYRMIESELVDFFSDFIVSVDAELSIGSVYDFIASNL